MVRKDPLCPSFLLGSELDTPISLSLGVIYSLVRKAGKNKKQVLKILNHLVVITIVINIMGIRG